MSNVDASRIMALGMATTALMYIADPEQWPRFLEFTDQGNDGNFGETVTREMANGMAVTVLEMAQELIGEPAAE